MGRGKLPMEYITTEKARKSSFKKRKEGLVKKIRELSILCGIDACLIVYGPRNNDGGPMEVHQWPKESEEVERILRKYELKRNESASKHLNLMDFFGNQTCKINEQIAKTKREIAKAKFAKSLEIGLENASVDELKDMLNAVDKKIETVKSCIEMEKEKQKMNRGIGAVELMKLDANESNSSSQIVRDTNNSQTYLGEQATEHLKPLQMSVADFNPYLPLTSLTDTYLTQNNYQTDLLADYIPSLNANDLSEYMVGGNSFEQFQGPNCEPQYFQTNLYAADAVKSYGMGYPAVGTYLASQQQQQNLLTSVLQGNCFQSADCCCASGDCYCNICGWQRERNSG